jgi:signal peptidase I
MTEKVLKIFKEVFFYAIAVIVSIILAVCLRVFVVTYIIKIPSGSMEPAVLAGDRILVNKQIPGPRVYRNIRQIRVDGKVQTKRFKGIRKVRRNDILVFNFPYSGVWNKIDMDLNVFYLKRCVALPGDTFAIENGIYRVKNCMDSLGCLFRQRELSKRSQSDFAKGFWDCFPHDTTRYKWSIKDFGPLYVPASGATINLDTFNFRLYKNLIEYETDKLLSVSDGLLYLGDDPIKDYAFRLNYYFMAGDNIFNSIDSRYWGLLPEDCIIGKAFLVWRSTDLNTGKIRWKRFFKIIK